MRAKTLFVTLSLLLVIVASVGLLVHAQKKTSCSTQDNEVYDGRIQQVKGKVMYLNHPDLGKTPANGQYLVFQREDCKDCLVATHADNEGNYKIFIGVGRYKLIVQETRCDYGGNCGECHNLLALDQAQFIDVEKNRPYVAEFNINLLLPKE
jgi:hypothetical protein